jgi:hypothetical protein
MTPASRWSRRRSRVRPCSRGSSTPANETRRVIRVKRGTTIPVGIYWKPGVWNLARSAYIADLDTDADSPESFVGWLGQSLELHARRSRQQRSMKQRTAFYATVLRYKPEELAKVTRDHPLDLEDAVLEESAEPRVRDQIDDVLASSTHAATALCRPP